LMAQSHWKANVALKRAAKAGDIGGIRAALAQGANNIGKGLFYAAGAGQVNAAAYLLNIGAGTHFAGEKGRERLNRVFYEVVRQGHEKTARLLIESGVDPRLPYNLPLQEAIKAGHFSIVALLLDSGVKLNGHLPYSPLAVAARAGRLAIMKLLLDRGADIHWGPLLALAWALQAGQAEAAQLLLDRGASPISAWHQVGDKERRLLLSLRLSPEDRDAILREQS
jgi:ankyrin repeat protein